MPQPQIRISVHLGSGRQGQNRFDLLAHAAQRAGQSVSAFVIQAIESQLLRSPNAQNQKNGGHQK